MIRLLGLLAVLAFAALLGRWLGSRRRRQAPRAATAAERMVRDRVCNTFLPLASAVRARVGPEEHFFCSAACRDEFLRRIGSPTG